MGSPQALFSWSTGKDGAFALHELRRSGEVEVVALVTTVTSAYGRVSMHGVRERLLDAQVDRLGLPCRKVAIPSPCSNELYEQALAHVLLDARRAGISHVAFGDLFLEDLRAYRERQLAALGLTAVFPLWRRDTSRLAREMIDAGVRAITTCVDPRVLPASFAGRTFDEAFLRELPPSVDPCGENGEFHTFVTDGPMFRSPISVRVGEVVERDGFVFADLVAA